MPPVFGPRSPSKMRLWSWLVASGSTCWPSQTTMKLASSPSMNSSMTTRPPGSASMVSKAAGAEDVDHAGRQRRLGPDDRQCHLLCGGEVSQCRGLGQRHVFQCRVGRGAAIAGGDEYGLHAFALRQLPGQRVLAAAAADD